MSRRDTIIVAVLVNTGMLAVLFMLALNNDPAEDLPVAVPRTELFVADQSEQTFAVLDEPSYALEPRDELDQVLKNYPLDASNSVPIVIEEPQKESTVVCPKPLVKEEAEAPKTSNEKGYVEVTVKRGDYLEKIARANGTTIEAIMRINKLQTERIDIGQVLKVPLPKKKVAEASKKNTPKQPEKTDGEAQYYTLKTGDNPWKVAKEFHVKFDDLLKLNDLNEEKARGLMPGDVLRVR